VRERQSLNTGPILASVDGGQASGQTFVHTIVPIADATGAGVNRIFIYSEKTG
jgi:hypothetical protein